MVNVFCKEDAEYLVKYYQPKIIGKPLGPSIESIIERLEIKQDGNDLFRVVVHGKVASNLISWDDIYLVTLYLNVLSPEEVLQKNKKRKKKNIKESFRGFEPLFFLLELIVSFFKH